MPPCQREPLEPTGWDTTAANVTGLSPRGIHGSGHALEHPGVVARLRKQQVSLGVVAWNVVGLVVASQHDFLDDLGSLERILSAVLAVIVWPLVLLDVHFGI